MAQWLFQASRAMGSMGFRPVRRLAVGFLLLSAPATAHDVARHVSDYSLQTWSSAEGLPQNTVTAIAQARDGYLWLGTQSGLVRFDGVRFVVVDDQRGVSSLISD